jgi:hypothetical protein
MKKAEQQRRQLEGMCIAGTLASGGNLGNRLRSSWADNARPMVLRYWGRLGGRSTALGLDWRQDTYLPGIVLRRKDRKIDRRMVPSFLIQWPGYPKGDSEWFPVDV